MLVSEEITPYDLNLAVKYDGVVTYPLDEGTGLTATDVESGTGFVYVEAVDFGGGAHLAGCLEVSIDGTTEATIVLRAPGTYDCSDPAVENGEFCDDGDFCTLGEECRDGTCVNGVDRDCSALQDACNTASCDSGIGCVVEPLPGLTSCSTGEYCVTSAVCMDGVCEGNERDCSDEVPECYAGVCDEDSNSCDAIPISEADCDDGNACTANDTCTVGSCEGETAPMDGMACNDGDACTQNTQCDTGACTGGAPTDNDMDGHASMACGGTDCNDNEMLEDPDLVEATGTGVTCSDGLDNDCDGMEDAADPDC